MLEGLAPVSKIEEDVGINGNTLYRLVHQFKVVSDNSFRGKGKLKPEDEELRRVKRELADVKEERDILKKAVAIFSRARQ